MNLLFKISYGLYVLSAREGKKDNACIINTLMQQTSNPERLSITVNKLTYTHNMVLNTKVCSCAIISEEATFDSIKCFGMRSGMNEEKFDGVKSFRSSNGCLIPAAGILGYFDLKVLEAIDLGSHTMFICEATDKVVIKEGESMTYAYYQSNVKPRPQAKKPEEAYICTVCGYIHHGPIPDDIICPICKRGRDVFIPYVPEVKEEVKKEKKPIGEAYICTVCGYIHYGPIPDDIICPPCKHGRDVFIPYTEE